MGATSSRWHFEHTVPEGITAVPPIWTPPPSSSNVEFAIGKYDKEYISTTLHCSVQAYSVSISTDGRKLILSSGDNTLGMAKRFGPEFRVFRLKPNYEGQRPCGKLRRRNDAPLYFHSLVTRKDKLTGNQILLSKVPKHNMPYISVVRLNVGAQEMLQIHSGPLNSFEKTCFDSTTGEELAFWKYSNRQNRVEVFQNAGLPSPDVGLMMFLTIISGLLDNDEMMDKAAVVAVAG